MERAGICAAILAITALGAPAHAGEIQLKLDPAATEVSFVLGATMHKVRGSFALVRGEVIYDPATGVLSGEIVVDATSGNSGNSRRDRDMHRKVLESEGFPTIVLRPVRLEGELPSAGDAQMRVAALMELHGGEHPVEIPVAVTVDGTTLGLSASFEVPYVEWGLKDPSKLVLRVAKEVLVTVDAVGTLTRIAADDGS
jgi:polyisoprenoid-binding protein YceI